MKKKLKHWFIKSALIDFQDGYKMILIGSVFMFLIVNFNIGILGQFIGGIIVGLLSIWYSRYGKMCYYYAICDLHKIDPKSKNINFK